MSSSRNQKGKEKVSQKRRKITVLDSTEGEEAPQYLAKGTSKIVRTDFMSACGRRNVLIERIFEEKFLRKINFPWLDRLKSWGWWFFLSANSDCYPNLVREFYYNGDDKMYDADGNEVYNSFYSDAFRTMVCGTRIDIEEDVIRKVVGDRAKDGHTIFPDSFERVQDCRIVFGNPELEYAEGKCSQMDLCTRVLHLIVCQALCPKATDFAQATDRELWWMARIMNNEPPNLSAMIVSRMLESVSNCNTDSNKWALPFGKCVSILCTRKCNIPDTEITDNSAAIGPLNEQSISNFGWKWDNRRKEYVRSKNNQKASAPVDQGSSQDQGGEISMRSLMEEMKRMHEVQMASLNGMRGQMDEIGRHVQFQDTQIRHINANIDDFRNSQNLPLYPEPFPIYQPPPPPPPHNG